MSATTQFGPSEEPMRVFLSYAREDSKWLDEDYKFNIVPFLANSLRRENVEFWIDKKLVIADEYRERIESEIDRSQIALLIVSQNFLSSTFIETVEMPRIQHRAQRGEMLIAPVLVEPCVWKENPVLADRHMMPAANPLIDYTDSEAKWARIRYEILEGLRTQIRRIRKSGLPNPPSVGNPVKAFSERSNAVGSRPWGIRHWALAAVAAAFLVAAAFVAVHFVKRPAIAGQPAPDSVPGRASTQCVNLNGQWRTPGLTDMLVTQLGCTVSGRFNSLDGAYQHTLTGQLRSNSADIVVNRTDIQGCLAKMYGSLTLNGGALTYTLNGTDGGCGLSSQWTETRIWTRVNR